MILSRPLAVVTPTVDGDVLAALAGADASFTPAQLHRVVAAHSESGIRKSLARLAEQGIVTQKPVGNARVYRLNARHLAAPLVVQLSRLRAEFLSRLESGFAGFERPPVFASVFGSAARGNMRTDSDIDVFVVRPDSVDADDESWADALHALERDASQWTGNDVRVLEMTHGEVLAGLGAEDPVLGEIRRDGLTVCGSAGLLRSRGRGGRG